MQAFRQTCRLASLSGAFAFGCGISPLAVPSGGSADGNSTHVVQTSATSGQGEGQPHPLPDLSPGALESTELSAAAYTPNTGDAMLAFPEYTHLSLADIPLCEGFAPKRQFSLYTIKLYRQEGGKSIAVDPGAYPIAPYESLPVVAEQVIFPSRFAAVSVEVYGDPSSCSSWDCGAGSSLTGMAGTIQISVSAATQNGTITGSMSGLTLDNDSLKLPREASFSASQCSVNLTPYTPPSVPVL